MNKRQVDVLVVGAGISGLVAAYSLKKQGIEVKVVERGSQPGGRMSTFSQDNYSFDPGARILLPGYRNLLNLAKELQVQVKEVSAAKIRIVIANKSHVINVNKIIPSLALTSLIPLSHKIKALLGSCRLVRDKIKLSKQPSYLDDSKLSDYAGKYLGHSWVSNIIDPILLSLSLQVSSNMSTRYFMRTGKLLGGLIGKKMFGFESGIGQLPRALSKLVDVEYGQQVSSINRADTISIVSVKDLDAGEIIEFEAKKVIIAIPGSEVLSIYNNPTDAEKRLLENVNYTGVISLHIASSSNLLVEDFCEVDVAAKFTTISRADNYYQNSKYVYNVLLSNDYSELLSNMSDEEMSLKIKELSAEITEDAELIDIHNWKNAIPQFPTNYLSIVDNYYNESKNSNVLLAGDYLVGGSMESAAESGLYAASQIHNER